MSCASSYAALDRAMQSIRAGDCDQAIVGGVNVITELTGNFAGHVDLMALLSSKGAMKSFSDDADGFVRSEGVGVIILKRKEQAQKDNNKIFALVKGTCFVHAGKNISWDSPNPRGIKEVVQKSLQRANVHADTIDYIEAHGVANRIADAIELEAISNAYTQLRADPEKKWRISSVKPVVGHSELASGMASLIATIKAFRDKTIPGIPGLDNVNRELAPDHSLILVRTPESWTNGAHPRRAALNSYAVGGVNAHVILEEYKGTGGLSEVQASIETTNGQQNNGHELMPLFNEEERRNINAIFQQALKEDIPTDPGLSFADLDYSSLNVLALVRMLNEKLGTGLTLGQVVAAENTAAFLRLVRNGLDNRQLFSPLPPDVTRFFDRPETGINSFIIPGMPGMADGYYDLAESLSGSSTVYGLHMKGVLSNETPLTQVEAMAAHNVELIKKVHPSKPVWLIAHSYGGIVAYEMLKQLSAMDITVAKIVLVECYTDVLKTGAGQRIAIFILSVLDRFGMQKNANIETEVKKIVRKPRAQWSSLILSFLQNAGVNIEAAFFHKLWKMYDASMTATYKLSGTSDVPATIICAEEPLAGHNAFTGWKKYFSNINIIESPGNHFSIVQKPFSSNLASMLQQ
jgi:thioesterase domain-containing protein